MTGSDPLLVDLMSIRNEVNERYVTQDLSFDLRVLMIRDGEVVDAYLFPWSVLAVTNANWGHAINPQQYKIAIPDDIEPEHLCNDPG